MGLSARAQDLESLRFHEALRQARENANREAWQFGVKQAIAQDAAAADLARQLREEDALAAYHQQQDALAREKLKTQVNIEGKQLAAAALKEKAADDWRKQQFTANEANRKSLDDARRARIDIAKQKLNAQPKAKEVSAAQLNALIDDLQKASKDATGVDAVNIAEQLRMANEARQKLLLPGFTPRVEQITPASADTRNWLQRLMPDRFYPPPSPTTNFVSALTAPSVTNTPAVHGTTNLWEEFLNSR